MPYLRAQTNQAAEKVLEQAVKGGQKARRDLEQGYEPMQLYRDAVARKSFWRAYAAECWAAVAKGNGRANGTD